MRIKGKICKNKNIRLFHISEKNHNNKIFKPRIPESAADYCFENKTIARICFSTSMSGAYRAICFSDNGWSEPFYVHKPENIDNAISNNNIIIPSTELVFDQKFTNEHWIREKIKMKCIGKAKFKYVKYNYVDNFRPKVRIKWLEKY